jgi:hypothetical protein
LPEELIVEGKDAKPANGFANTVVDFTAALNNDT